VSYGTSRRGAFGNRKLSKDRPIPRQQRIACEVLLKRPTRGQSEPLAFIRISQQSVNRGGHILQFVDEPTVFPIASLG
jgi:hypothetical protein